MNGLVNAQIVKPTVSLPPISGLKYDVDAELVHFIVNNVKDLDHTEDLFGSLYIYSAKALSKLNSKGVLGWQQLLKEHGSYPNGTTITISKKYSALAGVPLFKNLSLEELKNFELTTGGNLSDDEGFLPWINFRCAECVNTEESSKVKGKRVLKFIGMPSTQESISSLVNNGQYQEIKFGDDTFFELNFYESGIKANGWVKVMWKVWVKPHN